MALPQPGIMASLPTGLDVASYLGGADDPTLVSLCNQHVVMVAAMARSYTRGKGFMGGANQHEPFEDVAAVIIVAAARMVSNPEQVDTQHGSSSIRGGFKGWSLAELMVLNAYRGRAA